MSPKLKSEIWYGDIPNRRCLDCGELCDWDERKRLGYVPLGGPSWPDGTPKYSSEHEAQDWKLDDSEQAKLVAHADEFHRGGLIHSEDRGHWHLEVLRYSTDDANGRNWLVKKRPFYAALWTTLPNGKLVRVESFDGCRTLQEAIDKAWSR